MQHAILLSLGLLLTVGVPLRAEAPKPSTIAEQSDYQATSRHADVVDFCAQLAKQSPLVRLSTFGKTHEGRALPLMVLADPPVTSVAARPDRPVVLLFANIHAGEVDGKEALLALARELTLGKERELLSKLTVLIVPILNADGNEKFGKSNRPGQNGPAETGIRANAQGLDLNRDFIKLESPEIRSLIQVVNAWDPAIIVDMHTTNGSYHRYAITYDCPRHPASDPALIKFARDVLLADVSKQMDKQGMKSFFYGNFSNDQKRWSMYPSQPRFSTQYLGLRNRIGILCESYSYASFRERVQASHAFARACLRFAADNAEPMERVLKQARQTVAEGRPGGLVAVRHRPVASKEPVTVLGFVEEMKDGKRVATSKPKDYVVEFLGQCDPTLSVPRPYAYLVPPAPKVLETLQHHGVLVEELREDIELDVEAYRVDKMTRAVRAFQGHELITLEATPRKQSKRVPAGTLLVRSAQPLGTLASLLLEPQSEDGLATWNFFDVALKEGEEFPVLRLPASNPITLGQVRPLREGKIERKPITLADRGRSLNLNGNPIGNLEWLDDEHFLQFKDGLLRKVHAATGRSQPFIDTAKFAKSLATIPGVKEADAKRRASQGAARLNPPRTAALIQEGENLYLCPLDGSKATLIMKTSSVNQQVTVSPDGQRVAFVRKNDLYAIDIPTQKEYRLTSDGSDVIFNGRADWVYYEEIFNRSYQAFWWSPDSSKIAFLRFDDNPVKKFTVLDEIPVRQKVEITPYPKAGDPNPFVKVGIVSATGGKVAFVNTASYAPDETLFIRAGWTPDSQKVLFYAQDRAQTWLDVCTVSPEGGTPTKLFRDQTKAWIEDPGEPRFLKDGSFLLFSERTGWKHLYHFAADGKLIRPLTTGDWEARTLDAIDEEKGWVYVTGTRDTHTGSNLYRVRLDGTEMTRLTDGPGTHLVQVSPKGNLFIDSFSDTYTPIRVQLKRGDGTLARILDTNPVYSLETIALNKWEQVKIKTPDGFELEGMLLLPGKLDPARKYPVWVKIYGGPHMPVVRDAWMGGRAQDQVLSNMGYVVFYVDPRSASGKGAVSAWSAYKQLGVQEAKDLETAVKWLCQRPYIDASRIGLSGHSYGGYLTAFAMTHSKVFAAGIAGAPVTDWRNYDSIYTERYMDTPQKNPKGYDAGSVVRAAGNLHGKLLILHGNMDDNVHVQNTLQLVQALQRANKDFEMMIYPQARHGIFGMHYQQLMMSFMERNLQPKP